MIPANQLRIENFVLSPTGWLGKVYNVSPQFVTLVNDNLEPYVFGSDLIDPIPITPEWLERLGLVFQETLSFSEYFNKSFGNIKAYIINDVWFCSHFDWMCHKDAISTKRGWYVGRRNTNQRYDGWNYAGSAEVEHIHQLQNIYFALTGSELTAEITSL